MNVGLVVEGHGDVEAAPLLVRRLAAWAGYEATINIPPPLRVHRGSVVKEGEPESLRGKRTLPEDLTPPDRPEEIRHAKAWLDSRMQRGYAETIEQAKLTATMDLDLARTAASFDKLVREVCNLLDRPVPQGRGQRIDATPSNEDAA